jgi:hypothetical protein
VGAAASGAPARARRARRDVALRAGLLTCALLACSPMAVEWSTSARGYTGLVLCAVLASHLYRRLLNEPRRRAAIAWVGVCALGAWFHLYMAFVVATQVLHLLLVSWWVAAGRARLDPRAFLALWRALPPLAAAVLVLYVPVAPKLVLAFAKRGPGPFRADFPLRVFAELSGALGGFPDQAANWLGRRAWLLAVVAAVAAAGLLRMARRCHRDTVYVALVVAAPMLAMWLAAPLDLYPRFFVFALPFHVLALAQGLLAARDGTRRLLGETAGLGMATALTAAVALAWIDGARHDVPEDGIRAAARAMAADAGDGVLLCAIGGGAWLFQYYVDVPVFVPETIAEFQQAVAGAREVRCAHRPAPRELRDHMLIAARLAERYEAERFGNVTLTRFAPGGRPR